MEKISIAQLSGRIDSSVDLFICATSFEDRCRTIGLQLPVGKVKTAVVLNYENNYAKALANLKVIENNFNSKTIPFEERKISSNNPIVNCDVYIDLLSNLHTDADVLIDISTMTRENILILIKLAKERFTNLNFKIAYTPSKEYATDQPLTLGDIWLSRGVNEIRSVLGYAGEFSPLKKILLVVLVGFEYERAQILIDNYEPNLLYIGKASKEGSINDSLSQINDMIFKSLSNSYPEANIFEFSCKDISITKTAISEIITAHKEDYNIVISPMNNKLSTLAVASEVIENPDVQICYATTNQYNIEAYSQGCDFVYLMDISEI